DDHAPPVLQLHPTGAPDQRAAKAKGAIAAGEVAQPGHIGGPAVEMRDGPTDRQAQAQTIDRERILAAFKRQNAMPGANTADQTCLCEGDAEIAVLGLGWRNQCHPHKQPEKADLCCVSGQGCPPLCDPPRPRTSVPIQSERKLWLVVLTRFLHANRCPVRSKTL